MTQNTFIKIVRSVIDPKGARMVGSKEHKLTALARAYSKGEADSKQAIDTLRAIFADNFELDRYDYAAIEKHLKRY